MRTISVSVVERAPRLSALALALACAAPALHAQESDGIASALAEPAEVRFDAEGGALHASYGIEKLFDAALWVRASPDQKFRAAKAGDLVFTPGLVEGAGREQHWKLAPAPGSGLGEVSIVLELRTSAEGLAAETRGAAQQRFPLVRTSVGQSRNTRNNAVYDRHWDWLLSGPDEGATTIALLKRQADALSYSWESHGPEVELVFRPLYFHAGRKLADYRPWSYRVWKDSVGGWCSWWAYRDAIDARSVGAVAKALAAQHMPDFGCSVLQIDDGFQTGMGQPEGWLNWNAQKFPEGAAGLVKLVRESGFEPGVWIYSAFHDEAFVAQHEDWFVHDDAGKLVKGPWVEYALDANKTAALNTVLKPTYAGLKELGFRYVKVDSLRHLLYDAYHHAGAWLAQENASAGSTLRKYLGEIRKRLGPDTYVLACWGVLPEAIGLADGCRLGGDGFGPATLQQYNSWSGTVWRNDPDHCDLVPRWNEAKDKGEAALAEARKDSILRPTLVSMAGATLMLSDKAEVYADARNLEGAKRALPVLFSVPGQMYDYDPRKTDKLAAMQRTEILSGKDQSPIDAEQQGALAPWWLMEIDKPWEHWNVLAHFNAGGADLPAANVRFEDLGIAVEGDMLVYEFWSRKPIECTRSGFVAPALERGGTQVFAIRARLDRPQLLSTSRHISQGAAEMSELTWNTGKLALEGVSNLVAGDRYEIVLHLPAGWKPGAARIGVSDVEPRQEGQIVRMHLDTPITQKMFWTISFQKP